MRPIYDSVLEAVGNTPMVRLHHVGNGPADRPEAEQIFRIITLKQLPFDSAQGTGVR